jgi:DNA-binding beta-propeller fold protein YncE
MRKKSSINNSKKLRYLTLLLVSLAGAAQAQPEATLEFLGEFGSQGRAIGSFTSPTGASFYDADRVVIADRGNLMMQVCTLDGTCQILGTNFAAFRNQPGTFDLPHGVQVNAAGQIAVADEDNHAVQLCDITSSCKYKGKLNSASNPPSSSLGRWAYPQDTAFDSTGRIFGLDTGNHRIQVLRNPDMFVVDVLMQQGSGLGKINDARGIAIDAQDRMIISDTGNNRIQICDIDLNCTAFGSQGNGLGKFRDPVGVEVDGLGRIWVADTGNDRIQVCDYDGKCVAFGASGEGDGQFNAPHDVTVHASGLVAVVDTSNHRIQYFRTEASESTLQINAGMNDAWWNPTTPGQGFFITVMPAHKSMFMANFTFDTERPDGSVQAMFGGSGQRWVTGFGPYEGATAVLNAELSFGGVLDFPVPVVEQDSDYGTYTVTFSDCMNGVILYDFPDQSVTGEIAITRIAPDNAALCEALQTE